MLNPCAVNLSRAGKQTEVMSGAIFSQLNETGTIFYEQGSFPRLLDDNVSF
jgi:hypothetical protein